MIITHNLEAMNTYRNVGINNNCMATVMEKLSSGYQINRAADNAAELTISESMRSQIRGLMRSSKNAQDGISLIQTAEGALGEVHSMLQRIRELHVQGANDVNTEADRDAIQQEIDNLVGEIDRVAHETEFNTKKLLDGSCGSAMVTPDMVVTNFNGDRLTMGDIWNNNSTNIIYMEDADQFSTTQSAIDAPTIAGYDNLKNALQTQIVPQAINSLLSTFNDAFGYLNGSSIGIGLNLYNDPSSATMASVTIGTWSYGDGNMVSDNIAYRLSVNMGYIALDSSGNIIDDNTNPRGRSALETTIIHEMMHAMMDESVTSGMVGVSNGVRDSSNSFPKWFKEGMAQAAAGAAGPYSNWINSLGISSSSTVDDIQARLSPANVRLSSNTDKASYGTGYLACMYLGYLASGGSNISASSIADGLDKILQGIRDGKSLNQVIGEKTSFSGITDFENSFGDTASATFVKELMGAVGTGLGGLAASGGYGSIDPLSNGSASNNLFKLDTASSTIKNVYPSGTPKFTDGGLRSTGDTSGTGQSAGSTGVSGGPSYTTHGDGLWIQAGANSNQGIILSIGSVTSEVLNIGSLSVFNNSDATNGITTVDNAINRVSQIRSSLGAYQNRLEHTMSVDDNTAENLQSAESRIRDADMAQQTMLYAKYSILNKAGMSMLSQANQNNKMVLKLLG
jgi:flagellin